MIVKLQPTILMMESNIPVAEETLHKANMNDIVVAATDEPAFELIGKMYALGVGKK